MNTSVLTARQKGLLRSLFAPLRKRLRRHDPLDILDAVCYLVTTGCQWRRLPDCYPPHTTVYHHFRSWTARGNLDKVLGMPVSMRRAQLSQRTEPTSAVIDSQSVRIGLPDSECGVDGGKRVKGIKRHLCVDRNGYPLYVHVTKANVHDAGGCGRLVSNVLSNHPAIRLVKADMGYRGAMRDIPLEELGIALRCVKSNFGTTGFVPVEGRRVVERTFSWLQNYRRLNRNYERFIITARDMALTACVMFMLRYF